LGKYSQSIKNSNKNLIFFDDAGYALEATKKAGIKTCGIKDFPWNENEWDAIKEIANYAVDGIGDFDYKSIQKVF
jgi:HAD superfamily hydrolase